MRRYPEGVVITERDRAIFGEIFENRIMYREQIYLSRFHGVGQQAAVKRIGTLEKFGFLSKHYVSGPKGKVQVAYSLTPKALRAIAESYRHKITREFVKSDSVAHDLVLVEVRRRLERLKLVTGYYTENMLQACAEFSEREALWPFVQNNTDAVIEVTRQGAKTLVALEWENSEKAQERYTRKLVSYYSDARTPAVFYVCGSARIRAALAKAEAAVGGTGPPRCFCALLPDVLGESLSCTFTDRQGAKIVLS